MSSITVFTPSNPIFRQHTQEQHTQALANFLPNGELYIAKNISESNIRKWLRGLSGVMVNAESLLVLWDREMDVRYTTQLLEEWERTVGIPDDCFTTDGTIEQRRTNVLVKLSALGVQTEADFINLAALYGVAIEIWHGIDHNGFVLDFPVIFFPNARAARFTMIVRYYLDESAGFSFDFPIEFGTALLAFLQCLFAKLAPANVDIIWMESDTPIAFPSAFSGGFSGGF